MKEGTMLRLVCIACCLMLLVAGCGGSSDEAAMEKRMEEKIEEATGADAEVDMSDKGMKVKGQTEGGEFSLTSGEEIEIPEEFPEDVFIYRPSKALVAMKVPEGHSLSLTTKDETSKVVETYKSEMQANGWSQEGSMNMGDQFTLMYKKGDRIAAVSIGPSDDMTQITLTVGME
jgi:hypothetical protein